MQGYSFRCCVELDKAFDQLSITANDNQTNAAPVALKSADNQFEYNTLDEKVLDEIAGVLWRTLYLRKEQIEVDHVFELAK